MATKNFKRLPYGNTNFERIRTENALNIMKKLTVFLLFISGATMAQSDMQHMKDSLRNAIVISEGRDKLLSYNRLSNIYYGESGEDRLKMDTLLILYEQMTTEARQQNNVAFQGLAMANTLGRVQ